MKKVMILGAGNAQIDAIKYCKEKGYTVYGCSYTNTDPGIPLLDHFIQLDIKDVDGIAEYAKKEEIDVVYSVGSDLAMPTVMAVSEKLGLPHYISSKTAALCQAKHKMRTELGKDFKGNAPFVVCENIEDAEKYEQFPGMMKPVDSQGQRGCFRVDSVEDIRKNFEKSMSYSVQKRVIIEKFIDGPEISVNAFMVDGKVEFALVSDRIVFDNLPGGIIKEHLLPTQYTASVGEAEDLVQRVAEKMGILDGPLYMQIKLEESHPVLLEVTPRLDGCHMWNLIKHYCGVDLLSASLDYLLEGKKPIFSLEIPDKRMKLAFMCEKTGETYNREKYDIENAMYVNWYYQTGDTVRKLNGYMEKGGYKIEEY